MKNAKDLLRHCASMKNPPKGYGSIEAGMKAAALRSGVIADCLAKGMDYSEAAEVAEREVAKKYGCPF